ncbi:MAG: hypothetical protein LBT99_00175 [Bifidobacteriaceae bacterium]|jgi:hypothetical protein|nr:hypothetical protein [Bifidobacteriaceae bacterium]
MTKNQKNLFDRNLNTKLIRNKFKAKLDIENIYSNSTDNDENLKANKPPHY